MTRLATPQICTMTELREPQKVFDRAGGQPVAILKNSQLVGYLVPVAAVDGGGNVPVSIDELRAYLQSSRALVQPVLDYLKDK